MPKGIGYGNRGSRQAGRQRLMGKVQRLSSMAMPKRGGSNRPMPVKTPDTGSKPLRPVNRGRRGR
jgi:hypothetical protein